VSVSKPMAMVSSGIWAPTLGGVKQKLKQMNRADADATFLNNLKPLMVCLLFWMFLASSFDGNVPLYFSPFPASREKAPERQALERQAPERPVAAAVVDVR